MPEADTVEVRECCSEALGAPEPLGDSLPVRDREGEALALALRVDVLEQVVLAVPQADSVGVLEVVEEADVEPDTVLLLEEVKDAV